LEIAETFRGVDFVTDFRNVKRAGVRENMANAARTAQMA
jgi:hypothetical protein